MARKALTVLLAGAIFVAFLVACGLIFEQVERARDRQALPPVGRTVDIGGRSLVIDCAGRGTPAVILMSGATWTFYDSPQEMYQRGLPRPGYSWVAVQRQLAATTTTCWFDRAGAGWSAVGPYPRDSASQASDLHSLLSAAGVPAPYLLVAESSAALDARVYAGTWPGEVAGIVLVNAVHPDLFRRMHPGRNGARIPAFVFRSQDAMAQAFQMIGLYRLGASNRPAPAPATGMTAAEWSTVWRLTESSKSRAALLQDIASAEQSRAQARSVGTLGDRPLIVLSSETPPVALSHRELWMELQTDFAQWSTRGRTTLVDAPGGDPVYQAPDAIVELVAQTLSLSRPGSSGRRVPSSPVR